MWVGCLCCRRLSFKWRFVRLISVSNGVYLTFLRSAFLSRIFRTTIFPTGIGFECSFLHVLCRPSSFTGIPVAFPLSLILARMILVCSGTDDMKWSMVCSSTEDMKWFMVCSGTDMWRGRDGHLSWLC
ncbi:hypothetical protein F5Y18DRAFT_413328 [Xylariaceae sp. FL1019]|nr:hypothetical protein F5Y18DRAFT_413328 [Xylariaceae sp. FL1019]